MKQYGEVMFTDRVKAEQTHNGSRQAYAGMTARPAPEALSDSEIEFIATRDSFYIASVTEIGWPYLQHRGGPRGFLRVLGPTQIGFGDYRGNRQYISTGNLKGDGRVALFLMDYPRKSRLKLIGHAKIVTADDAPDLAQHLQLPGSGRIERLFTIDIEAFDWNCPQFITPRFSEDEIQAVMGPCMSALEAENAALKAELARLKQT